MTAVNQCNFDRITRSLRRVREEDPPSRQSRQDIALAMLGFGTLNDLEYDILEAADCGTTALRAEEFRQKRAHAARAAACLENVFGVPDLECIGRLDKIARDAVLQSIKRCHALTLEPLAVENIPIPAGLTPELVQIIRKGQRKIGCWDPWVAHSTLFAHRHSDESPYFS